MGALLPAIMSLRVRERLFRLASPLARRSIHFAVSKRRAVQVINHSVSDLRKQAARRACRVLPRYELTSCRPALGSRLRRCRKAAHHGLLLAARSHRGHLHRGARRPLRGSARHERRHPRLHPRLCRARRDPREFKYPALVAEDMYEPETSGRTTIGKLAVAPW